MAEQESAFIQAMHRHDQPALARMLAEGRDVDALFQGQPAAGLTPLYYAVSQNQLLMAGFLISQGAKVGKVVHNGLTPLHAARHLNIAQLLLDHGADPRQIDSQGLTPLHNAVRLGHYTLVQRLIKHGARLDVGRLSPLFLTEQPGLQRLLLESGAAPDGKNGDGNSLLHLSEDLDLVKLLLDRGVDVNLRGQQDATALDMAKTLDKLKLLIARGARLDTQSERNASLLINHTRAGRLALVAYLLAQHREAVAPDLAEALHQAVYDGQLGMVSLFLEQGLSADQPRPNRGDTPLMSAFALDSGSQIPAMLRLLLARGASPNAASDQGSTPLMLAASRHDTDLVTLLLDAGANPNLQNDAGKTALHFTLESWQDLSSTDVLRLLLARGANPNLRTSEFETPLIYAAQRDQLAAMRVLIASGKLEDAGHQLRLALIHARSRARRFGRPLENDATRLLEQALSKLTVTEDGSTDPA